MRYLFSYTSGISPLLTYHMNQRRHAGCLCIFGWGHLHFWTVMEIGRPREDLVVSCDLYTLAAAPPWLLRYFCSFFGGWRKYMVLLVFGFLVTISFCWSGIFFPRWLLPAISRGLVDSPPSKYLYGFRWSQRIIFYFCLYFRGLSRTLSPTCLLFCLPHCRLEHSTLLRAFGKERERVRTATSLALEEFICHNLSC